MFPLEPPKDRMIPKAIKTFNFIIFLSQKAIFHPSTTKAQVANDVRTGRKNNHVFFFVQQSRLQSQQSKSTFAVALFPTSFYFLVRCVSLSFLVQGFSAGDTDDFYSSFFVQD